MTKSEFRKIQKILTLALQEAEKEAIEDGVDIRSEEYDKALSILRTKLLEELGFTEETYEEARKSFKIPKKPISYKELVDTPEIPEIPEFPNVKEMIDEAIEKIPKPETKIVTQIVKEIVKEKPIINNTTKVIKETVKELDTEELKELKKDIQYLQQAFQDSKIPEFPVIPNYETRIYDLEWNMEKLKTKRLNNHGYGDLGSFNNAILDSRYYKKSEVDAMIAIENLWDRTGTNLTPHTATDTIQPGGYKSSDGTAGASTTTGGLTFKDGLYTAGTATSVSFGTTTQIPYMNAGGTDFLYSANHIFDGSHLGVGAITSLVYPFHVSNGYGTIPFYLGTDIVAMFQRNLSSSHDAAIVILSKNNGDSSIYFGDDYGMNQGRVVYYNNTDVLSFGAGALADILNIDGTPRVYVDDDTYFAFGSGKDARISYNGTNMIINPKAVGTGYLSIPGEMKVGDGGTTNYSAFEADGTLVFNGSATVFNDANVGSLVLVTGGTLPGVVELLESDGGASGIYTRGFAVNEQGSGSIEIPHDYKEGSNLVFHIHWVGQDAPSGTDNVRWQLTYSVTRDGVVTPATTTVVAADDTAYDTQYKWMRTDVATITGTNFKIGDQFNFTITRITATGDAYAGEAIVATIGFHYECDTAGSRTITAK